jgi:hypothetical protein
MLLSDKNGIKCDICGNVFRSQFTYYSYDCHRVSVDISKMETKKEKTTDVNGSIIGFDVCEKCHKDNLENMLENQK